MKRDIFHYFPTNVQDVFNAYHQTIQTKFEKNVTATPYHTISFALGFSFRYNMNGGNCTLHFMPYNNGTAVCVQYTIVQVMGARYGAHNQHILDEVEKILRIKAQNVNLTVEAFLAPTQAINAPIRHKARQRNPESLQAFVQNAELNLAKTIYFVIIAETNVLNRKSISLEMLFLLEHI